MRQFVVDPQGMQNPHLARFVRPDFYSLDENKQIAELRRAHLAAANLPADYDEIGWQGQRDARAAVFTSWYDVSRPNVVCTSVDNFLAALYLFVEGFWKPAECNKGKCFYRDPIHKYEMAEAVFSPPKVATEPAKTIVVAPRMSTKTFTLIQQAAPMMALTRPNTDILISELNDSRTEDEIGAIQKQFEENDLIHREFGGKGVLFPRSTRGSSKWSGHELQLLHLPGCRIRGVSFYSAARGRHPNVWIIDDPEDPKKPPTAEHRKNFFQLLLPRGVGMLTQGNICLWMTTRIPGSCNDIALKGIRLAELDPDIGAALIDQRFDDWNKVVIDLLEEHPDGTVTSRYPDHVSVAGYYAKEKALGKREAMAEYRGIAVAAGEFVFQRDEDRHGYMHAVRQPGNDDLPEEYMIDFKTLKIVEWNEFLRSLYIAVANDIADKTKGDNDFCASIAGGMDPESTPYLLGCLIKRMVADDLVWRSYQMAAEWGASLMAYETNAMQTVVYRMAQRYGAMLEEQGKVPPRLIPLQNETSTKVQRIIAAIRPRYNHYDIRLPILEPKRDYNGRLHVPAVNSDRLYWHILYDQLDTFTDEGASDHDDGPDAMQMLLRILDRRRGESAESIPDGEREDEEWQKEGVLWPRHLLPESCWTKRMRDEHARESRPAMASVSECDPYD